MRFSIRDLLWLTLVVAIGLGWWRDHRQTQAMRDDLEATILAADRGRRIYMQHVETLLGLYPELTRVGQPVSNSSGG